MYWANQFHTITQCKFNFFKWFFLISGYENFKTCVFHILLNNGCSINLKNNEGLTPLNLYLMKNHRLDNFCLFLENGSDPSNCIENIHSPLMIVLEKGSSEMVQCLLEHGVDVNHRGASNTTALHIALEKGNIITSLLKWHIHVCHFNSNVILHEWFNDISKRFVISTVM